MSSIATLPLCLALALLFYGCNQDSSESRAAEPASRIETAEGESRDGEEQADDETGPEEEPGEAEADPVKSAEDKGGSAGAVRGGAAALTEEEISNVLVAVNDAAIKLAELAMNTSLEPSVLGYARRMYNEHLVLNVQAKGGLRIHEDKGDRLGLSGRITASADSSYRDLLGRRATAFDRAYVESQVALHTQALQIIDRELLSQAMDPEFEIRVTEARGHVVRHLEKAQSLRSR